MKFVKVDNRTDMAVNVYVAVCYKRALLPGSKAHISMGETEEPEYISVEIIK